MRRFAPDNREKPLVPTEGLEPPHLAAHGPEPCASTNSATWALLLRSAACSATEAASCPMTALPSRAYCETGHNEKRPHLLFSCMEAVRRILWCPRRDSNPHTLRHMDLNHARLPIPPRGHCTALL